jgi:branched-chain amino acid aminotransferase
MAKFEAIEAGYEEALMLDDEGFVAEGSGECFFIVRDGKLITPPNDNSLESITQATVIELAKDMGIEVERRRITRDEVYIADEAFFTGTAAEVTPIREVDARIIGDGKRGPITKKLQDAYFDVVYGRNDKYKHYLTYI